MLYRGPIAGGDPLRISLIALRLSAVGLLVPYVFVYSPSLLLVAGSFSWAEMLGTALRLLAAIWMLATALGGADPFLGRLTALQRLLRVSIAGAAIIPLAAIWGPAVALALGIGLIYPRLRPPVMGVSPQAGRVS